MLQIKHHLRIILFLASVMVLASACSIIKSGGDFQDIQWHWTNAFFERPMYKSLTPDPQRFTIQFLSDNRLALQVDCNSAGGSYILSGSKLKIALGFITEAYCGDDSLDKDYLDLLVHVTRYELENSILVLYLEEGLGQMTFSK